MLKIAGLYTSYNELLAPEGGLKVAKNIVINSPNVAEPRRGFERLDDSWINASNRTQYLTYYKDTLFGISDLTGGNQHEVYTYDGANWNSVTSYVAANTDRYSSAQMSGNLYFNYDQGIGKIDGLTIPSGTITSGIPQGIGVDPSVTGASGFLANGDTVAYRSVFAREDQNENLVVGAPSNRVLLTNSSGGTRDATVRVDIPVDVRIGDFARLYRSAAVSTGTPNDELQLAAEFELTSTEVNQGYVDFTDSLDESLLGATLYTSASQEGIENANLRAPACKDLAVFRDCLFMANTRTRDSIIITITDAGLMSNGDTITLSIPSLPDTRTFTAASSESIAGQNFLLATAGTAAENTRNTCKSLCRVISSRITNLGYTAQYLENESAGTGLGEIQITRQNLTEQQFYVYASNTTPLLPSTMETSGTNTPSSSDTFVNGLYWSKPFEPEAVPLTNQTRIASKDAEIQRIIALDEALMIFKEDGLYRLTGYYPDFEIELVDASVRLVGNQTPAVISNEIYCLTQQGVMVISGSGNTRVISTPFEDELIEKLNTHLSTMKSLSFGVGYETARRYYLFHPESSGDTKANQAYVYNIFTKTWTIHTISATAGLAVENNFWLGDADSEYVIKERSSGTNRDYADYGFSTTITAINDRVLTIGSGADNISVGDVVYENTTTYGIVEAVDTINSTVTVISDPGFSTTTVDILSSIDIEMRWLPYDNNNPMVNKQIHTVAPLFKSGFAGTTNLDFRTDISPGVETVQLDGSSALGWGLSPWGTFGWGDTPVNKPFRQWVPRAKQRCTWMIIGLRHNYSFSQWKLQGIKLIGDLGTEKTTR